MASSYSTSLKLELIGSGDQSGTWGSTTNNNLGTLLEQAIVGQTTVSMTNADYTLTDYNGVSDEARNAVIIITGNQNATYNVICPAQQKLYIITNNLSASATAYFKPSGGTALSIANGYTVLAYCTGSTMVALNFVANATTATTATNATNATNATTASTANALNSGNSYNVVNLTASGYLYASGNVTAYSDERLKSDITTITNALDIVQGLRGTAFVKDGAANIGLIAQEVQKVLPQVVHETPDGYLSVAYGNIVGVLIEAVKELKAEVEELKKGK